MQRLFLGVMLLLALTAGAVGLAVWALGQRNEAERQKAIAEKALANLRAVQAYKALLEFGFLEARVNSILDVNGCPDELIPTMRFLASQHPDSARLKEKIQTIKQKSTHCR